MPSVSDNGQCITVDLHGLGVHEAALMASKAIDAARKLGRNQVKLIHGSSTSSRLERNNTIQYAVYDLLDRAGNGITGEIRMEGYVLVSLPLGGSGSPKRLTLGDLL